MPENKPILFGPLPPPYGGVSIFMRALSAHAAAENFRVWSYKGKPGAGGIFVNHRRFGHLAALLREGRGARIVDSTHFHFEYPNKILLPVWLAAKSRLHFRWIKILHDGSLPSRYEKFGASTRKLFHRAAKNIDELVTTSEDLKIWLRDEIKVEQNVSFIHPLLPLASAAEDEKMNVELSEKLARFSNKKKRVCSVGIFIPSYGFHNVAEAVEKMRRETGEDINLFLVDGAFESDEQFRAEVLRNRPWIEVAKDVPHHLVPKIFQASDCFVRAFGHESYGLSRIEALLCETPVIATDAGETRGMAIYKFGDQETLTSLLRKVLAGEKIGDTQKWARIFRNEAARNLEKYLRVIKGEKL